MNEPVTIRVIGVVSIFLLIAPLHAQTQAEINAAARADFTKADVDLNKTYQAVLAKLPAAEKQKLKEAQRAWIASRDAEAASAAKEAGNGSIAPTIRYGRMSDLTQKRIAELKAMIDNGSASGLQTEVSPSPSDPSSGSKAESGAQVTADSISPDKKWEYVGGDDPKIVKAGTTDAALHLSDQGPGDVLWAPDSQRFAFNYGQGRTHQTLVYQLRDGQWAALDFPGDNDEFEKQPNEIVAAQLKKEGLSEKKLEKQGKYLRLIWDTMKVDRWLDSNTAIVYVSLQEVAARRDDPGEMDNGYGADLLYTVKFDPASKWKIVKTHRMSEKEVKEHQ